MSIARIGGPFLALLCGCLGGSPAPAEEASASVAAGDLWLRASGPDVDGAPVGWAAGTPSVRETITADSTGAPGQVYQQGAWRSITMLDVRSRLHAFSSRDRTLVLSVDHRLLRDPFRALQGAVYGLIVYHRPAGSRHEWVPLRCGAYAEGYAPANEAFVGYFERNVELDMASRTLSFARAGDGAERTGTFEGCGIVERYPEIAARVMPTQVGGSWRFAGSYDVDLFATCDGQACTGYDDDTRAADESLGVANLAFLGVRIGGAPVETRDAIAAQLGTHPAQGAMIAEDGIDPGSPANRAGLRRFDLILTVDLVPVNQHNLSPMVQGHRAGELVGLEIAREDPVTFAIERLTLAVLVGFVDAPGDAEGSRPRDD